MMHTDQCRPLADSMLPRLLAMVLFTLAAFMGLLMAAAALGAIISGSWPVVLLVTVFGPFVWVAVWLGKTLWTSRPVPMWFAYSLGVVFNLVLFSTLLMSGYWIGAMVLILFWCPMLLGFRLGQSSYAKKPFKPKAFDDFA